MAARALRAFVAQDGTEHDWAGAILLAEFMDDVRSLRTLVTQYMKAVSKRR